MATSLPTNSGERCPRSIDRISGPANVPWTPMPLLGRASELVAVQLGSILGTFALEEAVADRSVLVSREPFSVTRSPGPLRHPTMPSITILVVRLTVGRPQEMRVSTALRHLDLPLLIRRSAGHREHRSPIAKTTRGIRQFYSGNQSEKGYVQMPTLANRQSR